MAGEGAARGSGRVVEHRGERILYAGNAAGWWVVGIGEFFETLEAAKRAIDALWADGTWGTAPNSQGGAK